MSSALVLQLCSLVYYIPATSNHLTEGTSCTVVVVFIDTNFPIVNETTWISETLLLQQAYTLVPILLIPRLSTIPWWR